MENNKDSSGEEVARLVWNNLSKILGDSKLLDTIQIVSVDDADPNFQSFKWFIFSRSINSFSLAVDTFINLREEGEGEHYFGRSLLFDEYDKDSYWFHKWESHISINNSINKTHDVEPKYEEGQGQYRELNKPINDTLDDKLIIWSKCLEANYPKGGASLWVSQRHSLRGFDSDIVSSAFCVLNKEIDKTNRFRISKILRDHIISHLLKIYDIQISRRHEIYAKQFANYLRNHSKDVFLCEDVINQIQALKPVIEGRLPLTIEGAPGTGKLSTALHIAKLFPKATSTPQEIVDNPIIIDCRQNDQLNLLKEYIDPLLESAKTNEPPILIFDNLEALDNRGQSYLVTIIENRLLGKYIIESDKIVPYLIFTIAPNLMIAVRTKVLLPELYNRLTTFRVTLPSLQQRLLSVGGEERIVLMKTIIQATEESLTNILPENKIKPLDVNTIAELTQRSWSGNYLELRQELLRLQLLAMNNN